MEKPYVLGGRVGSSENFSCYDSFFVYSVSPFHFLRRFGLFPLLLSRPNLF